MKRYIIFFTSLLCTFNVMSQLEYVNPFIGTSNFGTCNPGAFSPNGMVNVSPFNVMGSSLNHFDKDKRWWSTPYDYSNVFLTGFSHINLSGVGCPDMGALLLMPTIGDINVDYQVYGSTYHNEKATPGYYSVVLDSSNILCESTCLPHVGVSRFVYPKGIHHLILNLGEGLTNETGSYVRANTNGEIEGMKLLGDFCYTSEAVFPVYFVMKVSNTPDQCSLWKKQKKLEGVESEWCKTDGEYKIYPSFITEMAGDNIGVTMQFETENVDTLLVQLAVSYVSIEEARNNLYSETQKNNTFEKSLSTTEHEWQKKLSIVEIQGGNNDDKVKFYTALYHSLLHPNLLNDVSGTYPMMGTRKKAVSPTNRYTVFSLWDTYRTLHPLLTLLYPDIQSDMVSSMLEMYKESGWLPKWELYSNETYVMEGDPALAVIADSYLKGIQNFDISLAYKAMKKSAFSCSAINKLRPDNDDWMHLGFIPLRSEFDNSVSHALEYSVADFSMAALAKELGFHEDYEILCKRAMQYKVYWSKEDKCMRPRLADSTFIKNFIPNQGENFEPCPGFHEGTSWNYSFAAPFDINGLINLNGGEELFVQNLEQVFTNNLYDAANEPDIVYPYLFSLVEGKEQLTQKWVNHLIDSTYFNSANGIPGNDDSGTMSAWLVFSMMGVYPYCPAIPEYVLTTPRFEHITVDLGNHKLDIRKEGKGIFIDKIFIDGIEYKKYTISHSNLLKIKEIKYICK